MLLNNSIQQPMKRKRTYTLLLFLTGSLAAVNAQEPLILKAQNRSFFITQHQFSMGAGWIMFQPLKFKSIEGTITQKGRVGHSCKFDMGYTYWHNDYFGFYTGVGLGWVCYSYKYSLEAVKHQTPQELYETEEYFNERDLFFYIPITCRFNIPVKKNFSLYFEPSIQLTHHPRSLYQFLYGVDNLDNNTSYYWGDMNVYRNGRGQPIYPTIILNIGTMIRLPYYHFITCKLISNIHPESIVDGHYKFYNIDAGNDSNGTLTMNTSYFGIEVAYVFTRARKYLKKHEQTFD